MSNEESACEILNLDHLKGIKTLPIRDNLGYMDANCYGHGQNAITVKYIKEQPQSLAQSAPRNPNLLDAVEPVEDEPKDTDDVRRRPSELPPDADAAAAPNYPPRVLIQEASDPRMHPRPTLAVHPQQYMQRGQKVPFQAPHPSHGYAHPNSAFSLFNPGGPNGAASTGSGSSSQSASPIIGVGRRVEGDGSPLGDCGRSRGRTCTRASMQLDRHDAERSGSGNSNADRDVFKDDDEKEGGG
ncbi:hypothetical protein FIBSPDRAFT_995451 [Athelia psychrophila]|uniref:Uncharacterized protein n=1 Tax=Athelia psychrophila TaxID=1759441 RepID=A0A165XGE7_9AGAM|nr:hypothetical protein FIBSPDRAFT_995451 [Fibularhizoctonia sp. CBS 109695]